MDTLVANVMKLQLEVFSRKLEKRILLSQDITEGSVHWPLVL